MSYKLPAYTLIAMLFLSNNTFGLELVGRPESDQANQYYPGHFIFPNELSPTDGRSLFETADAHSTYLGFGTFRVLAGAFLSSAELIIFLDQDPGVTLYNRIETALLAAANMDIEKYRTLRLSARFDRWQAASEEIPEITGILAEKRAYDWWKHRVRSNTRFALLHTNTSSPDFALNQVNHIWNETVFAHHSRIARAGRMWSITASIEDSNTLVEIAELARRATYPIGTIDISNAYLDIDHSRLLKGLRNIASLSSPQARLIMYNFRSYVAYTFKNILAQASPRFYLSNSWIFERLPVGYWPAPNSLDDRRVPGLKRCQNAFRKSNR